MDTKKNIGILTFHNTLNYGSFLQTMGLYKTVESLGYDCKVIDYNCKAIEEAEIPQFSIESYHPKKIAKYFLVTRHIEKKYNRFQKDMRSFMDLSERYTSENICESNKVFDTFLVGSDLLWDLKLTHNDLTFFLDFVENPNKKYSFATSIGGEWNDDEIEEVKNYILDFKKISIRENISAKWFKELFPEKEISVVCDPTMLCETSYWDELSQHGKKTPDYAYVIVYFHTEEMIKDVKKYAYENHLRIICIGSDYRYLGMRYTIPESVCDWLKLIKNAEAVFTASYHGLLFSLYFHKMVFAYYRSNIGHNIRIIDVLTTLGIEKECSFISDTSGKIDYRQVDSKIGDIRQRSVNVLKDYWESDD